MTILENKTILGIFVVDVPILDYNIISVPWWIVHLQMTTWHLDPHKASTQLMDCCDVLLLWHFDLLMFYYCDTLTLFVLLLWHFNPVKFYYCDTLTL
jgi:hypothetical protein